MRSFLTSTRAVVALLVAVAFSTACSDSAFSPTPAPNSAAIASAATASAAKSSSRTAKTGAESGTTSTNSFTSSTTSKVTVLRFKAGVNANVSASKVIGPEGGYLVLAETGLTLVVPPGAVSAPTTFTVTPVGGKLVAYDFEPHGTTFAVPLTFTQDLSKTNFVAGRAAGGAYFSDNSKIDGIGGTAEVSELFTLSFDGFGWAFFSIKHFSGYLVSMA